MEIPKFLIERYQFWKKNTFEDYKDIYEQASKTAQTPIAMNQFFKQPIFLEKKEE